MFTGKNSLLSGCLAVEAVACAPDGLKPLRMCGIGLDLLAQTVHVDGDGRGVSHGVQPPDAIVECLLAEDNLWMLCEKEQQLELARGETHLTSRDKDAVRPRLNLEIAETEDGGGCLCAALEAFVACDVRLATREFELLLFLAEHPQIVFSKETLYDRVWDLDAMGNTSTVSVHMNRLREKIEPDPSTPQWLQTVWGAGYRFNSEATGET